MFTREFVCVVFTTIVSRAPVLFRPLGQPLSAADADARSAKGENSR